MSCPQYQLIHFPSNLSIEEYNVIIRKLNKVESFLVIEIISMFYVSKGRPPKKKRVKNGNLAQKVGRYQNKIPI